MTDDLGQQGTPPAEPALLPADAVRQSPEYKALADQNRALARQAGSARRENEQLRQQAEADRAAAEAARQAAVEQQIIATLGEDGVAVWEDLANLSATDPVAAAKRLAEFAQARAQSAATTTPPPPAAPSPGEGNVPAPQSSPTPPPARGLDASASLAPSTSGPDYDEIATGLERSYAEQVERNQNFATRNRVTMRDRGRGFIAYLGAAYLKAGARPKTDR